MAANREYTRSNFSKHLGVWRKITFADENDATLICQRERKAIIFQTHEAIQSESMDSRTSIRFVVPAAIALVGAYFYQVVAHLGNSPLLFTVSWPPILFGISAALLAALFERVLKSDFSPLRRIINLAALFILTFELVLALRVGF